MKDTERYEGSAYFILQAWWSSSHYAQVSCEGREGKEALFSDGSSSFEDGMSAQTWRLLFVFDREIHFVCEHGSPHPSNACPVP